MAEAFYLLLQNLTSNFQRFYKVDFFSEKSVDLDNLLPESTYKVDVYAVTEAGTSKSTSTFFRTGNSYAI